MKTYLIKRFNDNECFLKVGFTTANREFERHDFGTQKTINSDLPFEDKVKKLLKGKTYVPETDYEWQSVHTEDFEYEGQARLLEALVLMHFENIKYFPKDNISGYSECFQFSDETEKQIKSFMIEQAITIRKDTPSKLRYAVLKMLVKLDDPIEKHLEIVKRWKAQQVAED